MAQGGAETADHAAVTQIAQDGQQLRFRDAQALGDQPIGPLGDGQVALNRGDDAFFQVAEHGRIKG